MDAEVEVVIIGSGFAGLGAGAQLAMRGEQSFVILEQADRVGGVWRENTYPGCACDVRVHLYSFSFFPNPDWSHDYARQPELLDYLERAATHFGLRPHLRFGHRVIEAVWNGARCASDLVILDAASLAEVAVLELPLAVPHGLHGSWAPA